jgi:hypothetical protein
MRAKTFVMPFLRDPEGASIAQYIAKTGGPVCAGIRRWLKSCAAGVQKLNAKRAGSQQKTASSASLGYYFVAAVMWTQSISNSGDV